MRPDRTLALLFVVALAPTAVAGDDAKRQAADRKIELAERRAHAAELALVDAEQERESNVALAERDLELARAERKRFEKFERPRRIMESELALQRAEDSAKEAADELAQIEIMYKDQDLDDLTAEFVIARGKRNAARRRHELKLKERALEELMTQLDIESARKALEVDRKDAAMQKAVRSGRADILNKELALAEAQAKVHDALEARDKGDEKEEEKAVQASQTGGAQ